MKFGSLNFYKVQKVKIYFFIFLCFFAFFSFGIFKEFLKFKEFKSSYSVVAKVVKSYKKGARNITFLKFENLTFYTYSKKLLKPNLIVSVKIKSDKLDFMSFFRGNFFLPTFKIDEILLENNLQNNLYDFIKNQHKEPKIWEFYQALFLASAISSELRSDIVKWGISHLVAISGFHLGLLYGAIFMLLFYPYRFFQERFFPYRDLRFDLGIFVLICLGFYLYILDFVPSFLRSYVMYLVGFFLIFRGINLINYQILLFAILLILCFEPRFIFSVGFYFSCLGVFYIFLFFTHFGTKNWLYSVLFFQIYLFFAMNIPVYYFFSQAGFEQIFVILFSYIFIIFYPFVLVLHIFEIGNLLDFAILKFLNYEITTTRIEISNFIFYFVNLISLFAIKYKFLAIFIFILGVLVYLWASFKQLFFV